MVQKFLYTVLVVVLCFSFTPLYAKTVTRMTITKVTTLTGKDAQAFRQVYGKDFIGDERLSYNCNGDMCQVVATIAGFKGSLAERVLHGRKTANYTSMDEKFSLHCGKTTVFFCNVSQRGAVLA